MKVTLTHAVHVVASVMSIMAIICTTDRHYCQPCTLLVMSQEHRQFFGVREANFSNSRVIIIHKHLSAFFSADTILCMAMETSSILHWVIV